MKDNKNKEIIKESGIPFTDKGETLLFREEGMPYVDFYPNTGRWRMVNGKKTMRGGAKCFLSWYKGFRDNNPGSYKELYEESQKVIRELLDDNRRLHKDKKDLEKEVHILRTTFIKEAN